MSSFLHELAKAQSVPGGGGAAAQAALTGLALLLKVIALESGRAGLSAEQEEAWRMWGLQGRALNKELLRLRRRDGQAYLEWVEHRGGAGAGDYARTMAEVPLQILMRSTDVLELALQAGRSSKSHLRPDLLVVAELEQGAGLAAGRIAESNLTRIRDLQVRRELVGALRERIVRLVGLFGKAAQLLAAAG